MTLMILLALFLSVATVVFFLIVDNRRGEKSRKETKARMAEFSKSLRADREEFDESLRVYSEELSESLRADREEFDERQRVDRGEFDERQRVDREEFIESLRAKARVERMVRDRSAAKQDESAVCGEFAKQGEVPS